MKKLILLIVFVAINISVFSQDREPPIVFETLFGAERVNMSLNINKNIAGRFRYNNISSAAVPYIYQKSIVELVSVNSLLFQIQRHIGVSAGIQYHFRKGFIPTFGFHLSYASPTWLLVLTPYCNLMPWANMETVGVIEFKPLIIGSLRLFARLQGLYGYDFSRQERERAMCYFRLGLTYQKYTMGFGGNLDFYRPSMNNIYNYGVFVRLDI